jgi:uncharacterized protein YcsI (UPF0317 family)
VSRPPDASSSAPPAARGVREQARAGRLRASTAGLAPGYAQANLVVVPGELAGEFLEFCRLNPRPCPLLESLEPGGVEPVVTAPGADLRTDLPRYCIYRDGRLAAETTEVRDEWRADLVAFLLGCSHTFEPELLRRAIPLPHVGTGRVVAVYRTTVETVPAGRFHGPLVVSMRWIPAARVDEVVELTARFPTAHGAPVHVGDPAALGIRDLSKPDWGEAWPGPPDAVPVFWACGVTPQAVAVAARPELMITHAPGSMLVTDLPAGPEPDTEDRRTM